MDSFVTDTQALVKFMMGKKVINDRAHQAFLSADKAESTIIIPAEEKAIEEKKSSTAFSEVFYFLMVSFLSNV